MRLGTPAITTRGMAEKDMDAVGDFIVRALAAHDNDGALGAIKSEVEQLCARYSPCTRALTQSPSG